MCFIVKIYACFRPFTLSYIQCPLKGLFTNFEYIKFTLRLNKRNIFFKSAYQEKSPLTRNNWENIMLKVNLCYIYLYYIATRSLCVCLRSISSRTAGPIWLNFILLAPSWSREGFRPKKFRIRDPDPGGTKPYHLEGVEIELWCMTQLL